MRKSDEELLKTLKNNPELLEQVKALKASGKSNDAKRYDSNRKVLYKGEFERFNPHRYQYSWTDNKNKRHVVYADDLDALRRKERQIQKDIEEGIQTNDADNITVGMMWNAYMESKEKALRDKSKESYTSAYNSNIKPYLEIAKVRELHYSDIVKFYSTLLKKKNSTYNQMKLVNSILNSIFELCIRNQYLTVNPCKGALASIKDACRKTEKKEALTVEQEENLLQFISENGFYKHWLPFITVELLTGMRISELCGLSWSEVDFENNQIVLEHQLQKYKAPNDESQSLHLCDAKTEAGERIIPLFPDAKIALLNAKEFQTEFNIHPVSITGIVNGKKKTVSDFCFIKTNGMPFSKDEVNHSLRRIRDAYNKQEQERADAEGREPILLDKPLSSHVLRHTFSTRLAEADVNMKVHQEIMGHENIKTTMNIYTDAQPKKIHEEVEKAIDKMKLN